MPKFQSRHMNAIALAVSTATLCEQMASTGCSNDYKDGQRMMRAAIMHALERMLTEDNPNFDPMRFRDACLVK